MFAVRAGRRSSSWIFFVALSVAAVLVGCKSSSEGPSEEGQPDRGTSDGGTSDGGTSDGGFAFTWGSGTETGRLEGDLWTPGRDTSGLVNQVSWALVPKGRWIEVSGTAITSLDAQVKAAIPGFRDLGSQGIAGVINAYSGVGVDAARARWWAFGGGHADSSNNGLYRFDMANMRWSIEQLPDDPSNWAGSGYADPYSNYPPAAAYAKAHPDSDVFGDEFFDPDRPAASTGHPVARHTYNGIVYNPDLQEVAFGVRRMWRYSLITHTWKRHNPFNTPGAIYDGATGYGGAAGWTFWDEVTHRYFFGPPENGNQSRWWSFDTDDQSWKWEVVTPPAWFFAQMARVDRKLVSFPAPMPIYDTFPPRLVTYELDTGKWETVPLESDLEGSRCYNEYFEGQILAYVPPRQRYVAAFRYDGDGDGSFEYRTFEIDPSTRKLRAAPEYEAGAFGGWHDNIKNRFFYLATHDALVYVRKGEENLRIFRLP